MSAVRSHGRASREPLHWGIGWLLAIIIMAAAVLGPPLSSQGIPTPQEFRHDILTLKREFERSFLRPDASRGEIPLAQIDYLRSRDKASQLASEDVE